MSFKIVSVGDYMTGENVHHFGRGICAKFKNRYNELIGEDVKDIISDGDVLFLNFESSLAEVSELNMLSIDEAVYVAPIETFNLLKTLEIPVVANIANNHFGQHGTSRSLFSIKQLKDHGITVVGENSKPVEVILKDFTLKIWGVSLVPDSHFDGSYFKSSYEKLLKDLDLSGDRKEDEYWIISIHWGKEYSTQPNEEQKNLAIELSNGGFDVILGHHPHTIQPVERIKNTWVFYSHGNFLFDQNFSSLTQIGLVAKVQLKESKTQLYLSQQKDYRVVSLTGISQENLWEFCADNYSDKKPLQMRILMKMEMVKHFYELNYPIIKTFAGRVIKTRKTGNAKQI